MTSLRVQLLGGLQVTLDGKPARGLYEHVRALLAYVCAEPERPVSRDMLAELLWPEEPEQVARRNFRQALSRLRQVVGDAHAAEPLLLVSPGALQLNPRSAHVVDLHEFLAAPPRLGRTHPPEPAEVTWLEAAVALYRGPFLDQFYLADNGAFDQWVLTKREALKLRALGYLRMLAGHFEAAGELAEAAAGVRRQIEIEPWLESAHRHLMLLLAQGGQRGAALAQYNVCKTVLWDELGVEPDELTSELRDRIARGDDLSAAAAGTDGLSGLAERRHVSVLCCGLDPARGADAEPLMELDDALRSRCAELAHEFQAQRYDDALGLHRLVFGYPQAHEDDGVRAVLAAHRLLEALPADAPAELRVGLDSGLIVVSEDGGPLLGAPISAATRLRFLAPPGGLLLGEEAAALVRRDFVLERGEHGYAVRHSRSGRADSLARGRRRAGFFGRARELRRLQGAWAEAREGMGGCCLITAEPGMGKSRLLQVFRQKLAHEAPTIHELRCQPRYQASSLQPVVDLLERLCGLRPSDDPQRRRRRLDEALAGLEDGDRDLLARLLGLEPQPADADPLWQRRAVQLAAELQLREAGERPTLWILEDVHWADPATFDMLRHMLERLQGVPMLLLLTGRPGHGLAQRLGAPLTELDLGPLDAAESRRLARAVAGTRRLGPELLERIVERTDGVPLFVQELTEAALERLRRQPEADSAAERLPVTLQDSLMARLDGVGAAKRLAQEAAVIGREFERAALVALDGRDPGLVEAELATLVAAGIVVPAAEVDGRYLFAHALFQEVALQSLLKRQQVELHGRLAELLARQQAEGAAVRPEVIAQHYAGAERWDEAIDRWIAAGQQAHRQAMHAEAVSHFRSGLALVPRLPQGEARDRRELALQLGLGMPLMFLLGPVPEMEQAYERALELTRRMPDTADLFGPARGLYTYYLGRAEYPAAAESAEQMLRIGRAQRRDDFAQEGFRAQGLVLLLQGRLDEAARRFQHVLMLQETSPVPDIAERLGVHPAHLASVLLAGAESVAGFPAEGCARALDTIAEARAAGHSVTLGIVLNLSLSVVEAGGELERVEALAAELQALAERQPMPVWALWARIVRERAAALRRDDRAALEALLPLLEAYDRIGPEMGRPYSHLIWADTCLRSGRLSDGLALVDGTLARAVRQGAWLTVPDLHRQRAELLLAQGDPTTAAEALRAAIRVAEEIGAAAVERRCRERLRGLRRVRG